jgi:hypothetical protein
MADAPAFLAVRPLIGRRRLTTVMMWRRRGSRSVVDVATAVRKGRRHDVHAERQRRHRGEPSPHV